MATIVESVSTGWHEHPTIDQSMLIYFTGCGNGCVGCHNTTLKHPRSGEGYTEVSCAADLAKILRRSSLSSVTRGVVLLGGDPLYSGNAGITKEFCAEYGREFSIAVYTGAEWSKAIQHNTVGADFVKSGGYLATAAQPAGKRDGQFYMASTNQELYHRGSLVSVGGVASLRDWS